MKKRKNILESKSDRAFNIINVTFATLVLLVVAYPIIIVISSSFSNAYALLRGEVWLYPIDFTLDGYKAVLQHKGIWKGMFNSLLYTVFGTFVNMVVSVLAAYPLSRKDFTPRGIISLLFAFTMWFSGGLIPTYLLVKQLGLFDTRWAKYTNNVLANAVMGNIATKDLESSMTDTFTDADTIKVFVWNMDTIKPIKKEVKLD